MSARRAAAVVVGVVAVAELKVVAIAVVVAPTSVVLIIPRCATSGHLGVEIARALSLLFFPPRDYQILKLD